METAPRRLTKTLLGLALLAVAAASGLLFASDERYDYDELGRLIRVVPADGIATRYQYDAVGNILQVTNEPATAPVISGINIPVPMRCGSSAAVVVTGSGLEGARVTTSTPFLVVSDLRYTDAGITFTLTNGCTDAIGAQTIQFANAGGVLSEPITTAPVLPQLLVTPAPLALPPSGKATGFLLGLSNADSVPHHFNVTSSDPTVVGVGTPALDIAAGLTQVTGQVTGLKTGQAALTFASDLGTTAVPVFVTADFAGVDTSYANRVGVQLTPPPTPVTTTLAGFGALLGVNKGDGLLGMAPNHFSVGTGPTDVTVRGFGLASAASVRFVPPTGLTAGPPSLAQDGSSLTFPLSVAADAPVGERQLVIARADGSTFAPVAAGADRFWVTVPLPEIDSITPEVMRPGDTDVPVTIRGQRLLDIQSITVDPPGGISASQSAVVAPDGTQITGAISIAPDAQLGPRTVTVTTRAGSSDPTPSPANTFQIALNTQSISPLLAPQIGVQFGTAAGANSTYEVDTRPVGVAKGAVLTGLQPAAGAVGTSLTLNLLGQGLAGVTQVVFEPATGLTAGAPIVAADGSSVTLPLTVAADAPMTVRRVRLFAGTTEIPPVTPGAASFTVVAPQPQLSSLVPLHLTRGQTATVTASGANLQGASVVVTPSDGLSLSAPVSSTDGTQSQFTVTVAAGATLGARVVQLVTPAGSTPAQANASNTLYIDDVGSADALLLGSLVGVTKQDQAGTATPTDLLSPLLGVVLDGPVPTSPAPLELDAGAIGVAVGPVITAMAPSETLPGQSFDLVFTGSGLGGVSGVSASPADSTLTLGSPTVSPDGTQVTVSVSVAAGAAAGPRSLVLSSGATAVPFAGPALGQLMVGWGTPQIDSIDPILAGRGTSFTLTVRGSNLFGAKAVLASPAGGLHLGAFPTVDATGTQVTVAGSVDTDAPLGPRVIQVSVPGAVSSGSASPANTFTIYDSVP